MADVHTSFQRSYNMSRILRSGNASTEGRLIGTMRRAGITGWRRNFGLFGSPDFTFPKLKLVIFVDGCFWHLCPKHSKTPRTNTMFWKLKLESNKKRDQLVSRTLRAMGWRVLRIWEHELAMKNKAKLIRRLTSATLRTNPL